MQNRRVLVPGFIIFTYVRKNKFRELDSFGWFRSRWKSNSLLIEIRSRNKCDKIDKNFKFSSIMIFHFLQLLTFLFVRRFFLFILFCEYFTW